MKKKLSVIVAALALVGLIAVVIAIERKSKTPMESDYVVKKVDHAAMRRDFPKYDEYVSSNCTKGMTYEEAEAFEREHEAEYSSEVHVKTKYFFIRCRITYIGGGINESNEKCLTAFDFLIMNEDKIVGVNHPNCYFDLSEYTEGKEQKIDSVYYKFKKVGDSIECILGGRLRDDEVTYSDEDQFNPAIDVRCVALKDMPKEP